MLSVPLGLRLGLKAGRFKIRKKKKNMTCPLLCSVKLISNLIASKNIFSTKKMN